MVSCVWICAIIYWIAIGALHLEEGKEHTEVLVYRKADLTGISDDLTALDQEKRKRKKEQVGTEKMQYLFETQVQETSIRLSIWSCRGNPTSV